MSYTNSTTHYGFPLPLGTDLTVPMDYNQAFNDIDEHLFDAETDAETAATAAANAVETANGAAADVANLGTTVNAHDGRLTSLEQHDIVQDNKIDAAETAIDNKFDSVGIADAYLNGLTYAVDDVVTYNGQRYVCITAVTAAEPFDSDKWQGEDVQTVIDKINYEKINILDSIVHSVTADGVKDYSTLLHDLSQTIGFASVSSKYKVRIGDEYFTLHTCDKDHVATFSSVTYSIGYGMYAKIVSLNKTGTSRFNQFNVSDSGNITHTDNGSSVPTSGTIIAFIR